jgi:hypothetical protein
MSKGNDSRTQPDRTSESRTSRDGKEREVRTSRSSVAMTAERARAIQAHADRAGRNEDFKARAMSAAATRETVPAVGGEE